MTQPAPLIPTFAPAPSPTTAPASTARNAVDLEQKLAGLSAEQLAAVERYVDTLAAGGEPPVEASPLEVVATRWWFPSDLGGVTPPLAIQQVRGLTHGVVQMPEHDGLSALATLHRYGGGLATTLRTSPDSMRRWFADAGVTPVKVLGDPPPSILAAIPAAPPWTGYAPRIERGQPSNEPSNEPRRRGRA